MHIFIKWSFLILIATVLASCFNPNKLQSISTKLVEIKPRSLNSVIVVLDNKTQNDAKRIEINDSAIEVSLNEKIVGKVFLEEPFVVEKGMNNSELTLRIVLNTNIFNYKPLLTELLSADARVYIDGYVKIKYGMIRKKVRIKNIPIAPSTFLGELNGIFM